MRLLPFCLLALSLALAACKGEKKSAAEEGRTAQGQVLPGSASDAMLPLDTVRSQPPLAPPEETTGKPGKSDAGAAKPAGNAASAKKGEEDTAEPAPTATPRVEAEKVE